MGKFDYVEKVNKIEQEAFRLDVEGWLRNEVFTWQWWLLVVLFVVPWLLWVKFANRDKLLESVLFGLLISSLTVFLDIVGMSLDFWVYPTQFLPIIPRAFPFDMAMVPVAYMFLYQYFSTWRTFFYALVVMSSLYAFVGEPISVRFELVQYIRWHYIYSFFYYIIVGLFVRWLVLKIKESTQHSV